MSLIGQRSVRAAERPEVAVIPGGTPEGPAAAMADHLAASRQHLERIAHLIRASSGPGVLETATVIIPANGAYECTRYRVPYGAVTVMNLSGVPITAASAANMGSAPGGGQGQVTVPGGMMLAFNMTGTSLTFYGRPGAPLVYTVHTGRIPPNAALIPTTTDTAIDGSFAAAAGTTVQLPAGFAVTGFDITAGNVATAGAGTVTIANLAAGTQSWDFEVVNGANSPNRLIIRPPRPLQPSSLAVGPLLTFPAITAGPAGVIVLYGA